MVDKGRVVITGGTGFLGRTLAQHLTREGYEVLTLGRQTEPLAWNGRDQGEWSRTIDGAAAVINLTGRSVDCRYNDRNRRTILHSRLDATRAVGQAIANAEHPPPVWLNASSATIYPHSLDRDHTEDAVLDPQGFSEDVCRQWEATLAERPTPDTRKVAMRITIAFGPEPGGAFDVLHRLVRFGLGGSQGPGDQVVSWIHTDDFCRAVSWVIDHEDLAGPINFAAPNPVGNKAFMRLFRRAARMPIGLPSPTPMLTVGTFLLRTERELVLKSRRVVPQRLTASGFTFEHPTWGAAVSDILARRT